MKPLLIPFLLLLLTGFYQISLDQKENVLKIAKLIEHYSKARETQDTVLLKEIISKASITQTAAKSSINQWEESESWEAVF